MGSVGDFTWVGFFVPWDTSAEVAWWHLALVLLAYLCVRSLVLQMPLFIWVMAAEPAKHKRVYKIDYKRQQFLTELRSLVANLILDAVFLTAMVKCGLAVTDERNVLSSMVFAAVIFEIWFYLAHRALHTRLLYPLHRLHHLARVPDPLTAMTFSASERVILLSGMSLGLWVVSWVYPISFAGVGVYFGMNFIFNLIGHSNVEIYPPTWRPILALFTTPSHHSLHHARMNGNFGLHTRILDRIFGTEFPDYIEVQRAAYFGQGLTKLGQRIAVPAPSASGAEDWISAVISGQRGLCETAVGTDLKQKTIGESVAVLRWLKSEMERYEERTDQESGDWYVQRNGRPFGPLSIGEIRTLAVSGCFIGGDICFSLHHKVRFEPGSMARISSGVAVSAAIANERELVFVNRRRPRFRTNLLTRVRVESGTVSGLTVDLNERGASLFTRAVLEVGQSVMLELPEAGSGRIVEVRATVCNRRPSLDQGVRYGLKFEDPEHRGARVRLKQLVEENSALAA